MTVLEVERDLTYGNPESRQVRLLPEADEAEAEHDGGDGGGEEEEEGVGGHQLPVPSEISLQPVHCSEPAVG